MSAKRQRKNHSIWILMLVILVCIASVNTVFNPKSEDASTIDGTDSLVVRYVDVGQGDCEIISLPDGRNIIIDGSTNDYADSLVRKIKDFGIEKFDFLIATHPHEDHIGGLDEVVQNFEIGQVYMPNVSANTKTFADFVSAVKKNNISTSVAKAGVVMIDEDGVKAEFLAPNSESYDELNNYSAVLKFTYKNCSFLFTGDAETVSEYEMLESGMDLSADVLKLGHHGSSTSTSNQFLRAVNPDVAVIEVGRDNSYGHPHDEILKKLEDIPVYRTDINGTVMIKCDGNSIDVFTEN